MTARGFEDDVSAATVKIVGDQDWGTGFFIAPDRVLTCAHVIERVLRSSSAVSLRAGGRDLAARRDQMHVFPTEDVAIIDGRFGAEHYLRLGADLRVGDNLYAFGYTEEFTDGDSLTADYEGPTHGADPLLKLKGGLVQHGMSGAPLFNPRSGVVVGVLVSSRDRRSPVGGRAVPVGTVNRALALVDRRLQLSRPVDKTTSGSLETLASRLTIVCDELADRRLAGSENLTVRDLVGGERLLMPFQTGSAGAGGTPTSTGPLPADRLDALPDRNRVMVLGAPGSGKSTLALSTFLGLARQVVDERRPVVPLFVDLRAHRHEGASDAFGSREWLRERFEELTGLPDRVALDRTPDPGGSRLRSVVIVDSVDEFLAAKSPSEVRSYVSRHLFQRADLLCCRSSYYLRFLAPEQFPNHDLVTLGAYTDEDVRRYVRAYYRLRYGTQGAGVSEDFLRRIETGGMLTMFRDNPLRLNMALDLLAPDHDELSRVTDLLGLYHAYVDGALRREAVREGSVLSSQQKRGYLESLAFEFYDEENIGEETSTPFTVGEYDRVVAGLCEGGDHPVAEVAEDLRSHSLLETAATAFTGVEPGTLSFVHKSFQEYLVASCLFHSLLTEPTTAARAFQTYLSPEVSEFLKEYMLRTDTRLGRRIAEVGMAAYEGTARTDGKDELQLARDRVARQALGYYLGNLPLPRVRSFLRAKATTEPDRWIRRGITIGLAIGGDTELLDRYVDTLREERAHGGDAPENRVNTGFNLTFFGDQPFDPMRPDHDQGLPSCRRTISRLIYQMRTTTDRGSWRLDLHSVLDIWRHREASRVECARVLREQLDALRRLSGTFHADETCRSWPELASLDELIRTLDDGGVDRGGGGDPDDGRPVPDPTPDQSHRDPR